MLAPRFRLVTFGRLALLDPDGEPHPLGKRRRKLAVLAYVALAPRPVPRDVLATLFWGDTTDDRARHALSDALSSVRAVLGRSAIDLRSHTVALSPDAPLVVDAVECARAAAAGDHTRVLALATGPFLDGVAIEGSTGFETWTANVRARTDRAVAAACAAEWARLAATRDWGAAAALADRWLEVAPLDAEAALARLRAEARDGSAEDARQALALHARYERTLAEEFGAEPDGRVSSFAAELARPRERPAERAPVAPPTVPSVETEIVLAAPVVAVEPPSRRRVRRPLAAAGAVVAALAVGAGAYGVRGGKTAPAERPQLLVADAESDSSGGGIGGAVTLALTTSLASAPELEVLSRDRVQTLLARARRARPTRVDEELARDLAQRGNAATVVVPSVVHLGTKYALSARVVDAATGSTVATVQRRAEGENALLNAVEALGRDVRRALGGSALAARRRTPLPPFTTSSLPALRAYADGLAAARRGELGPAQVFYRTALSYDSTFAAAHATLGALASDAGEQSAADAQFAAALRHADHLPPREALGVRATVAGRRGDWAGAAATYRAWVAEHPRDVDGWERLGHAALRAENNPLAVDAFRRALALDSSGATIWVNLATVERRIARTTAPGSGAPSPGESARHFAAALNAYAHAFALDSTLLRQSGLVHEYGGTLYLAGRRRDAEATFQRLTDAGTSEMQGNGHRSLAWAAFSDGAPARAASELARAAMLHAGPRNTLSEARDHFLHAAALDAAGDSAGARRALARATALARTQRLPSTFLGWLGAALARHGAASDARALLTQLDSTRAAGSPADSNAYSLVAGTLATIERRDADAESSLAAAARYAPQAVIALEAQAWAAWTRARRTSGAERATALDSAASRYARLGRGLDFGWEGALGWLTAPYWRGRALEERGDVAGARAAYAEFLARYSGSVPEGWAPADARARIARIDGGPRAVSGP